MAFMTLKPIVFQNKKILTSQFFVSFIVCLLPSLVNDRTNMTLLLPRESVKGISVRKFNFLKELVMNLLTSTRVFHKKSKLIFDFCHS